MDMKICRYCGKSLEGSRSKVICKGKRCQSKKKKEYSRRFYWANREKMIAAVTKYQKANPEKHKAYAREYNRRRIGYYDKPFTEFQR